MPGIFDDLIDSIDQREQQSQPLPPEPESGHFADDLQNLSPVGRPDPMEEARKRQTPERYNAEWFGQRALPFVSAIKQAQRQTSYGDAVKRVRDNKPMPGDYDTIARFEKEEEQERNAGTLGTFASGLANIPAIAGEAAVGDRKSTRLN